MTGFDKPKYNNNYKGPFPVRYLPFPEHRKPR